MRYLGNVAVRHKELVLPPIAVPAKSLAHRKMTVRQKADFAADLVEAQAAVIAWTVTLAAGTAGASVSLTHKVLRERAQRRAQFPLALPMPSPIGW